MAKLKTQETSASVDAFIDKLIDPIQREDTRAISAMMERISGEKAKMWGSAIIGFGSRKLKYESGRELDWMKIGFSPRKGSISLYLTSLETLADELAKFGKYKTGKGCIYVKRLDDIDQKVLEKMIKKSLKGK
jgi:hypothetical protein